MVTEKKKRLKPAKFSLSVNMKMSIFPKEESCSADKLFPRGITPLGSARNQFREAFVFPALH